MRKILLSLAVLGGVAAAGGAASAAPAPIAPMLDNPAHVQTVQYYAPDWRARHYWQHRRHEWRHERREARRYHRWERHGWHGRAPYYARGW